MSQGEVMYVIMNDSNEYLNINVITGLCFWSKDRDFYGNPNAYPEETMYFRKFSQALAFVNTNGYYNQKIILID